MLTQLYAFALLLVLLAISGCHRLSTSNQAVSSRVSTLFGKNKIPEITVPDSAELAQQEKLLNDPPKNQWVYFENPQQGTTDLQNKNHQNFTLSLRLNCKISSQHPAFSLTDADGAVLMKAYDSSLGAVQFLLDNKNYGNPFDLHNPKKMAEFKTALASAKVIKLFNASKLYSFQNRQSELLNSPVSCRENQ